MQKPNIVELEDGGILIEWVKETKRFGITIERNISDSGWYFVSKEGEESDYLSFGMLVNLEEYFEGE